MKLLILSILMVGAFALERAPSNPLQEDFGYVEVRPGAHMFWVTYHTDGQNADETYFDYETTPLIMWLQGGPGSSGVGYGNFHELGPTDISGTLRDYRWTKKANVMFVDNPVGTGYSYVENNDYSLLTTTNAQIADDLVALLKSVFTTQPEYQTMPFYVFCESYGGKMTADFALAWIAAINNNEVISDFKGVGLGDSWISPMDSVNTWGAFLYSMGFVNEEEQAQIDNQAANTQAAVDAGEWQSATNHWVTTENVVELVTGGVNFYNVLTESDIYSPAYVSAGYSAKELKMKALGISPYDSLDDFMNSPAQRARWNIPSSVTFGSQEGEVFTTLEVDFMKPVIDSVTNLIDNTDIHVSVYTGDLDLICDTPGTYRWIDNMQYSIKTEWEAKGRDKINIGSYPATAAYVQRYNQFSLFTILRAGHMVPLDAGDMSFTMIDMIYGYANEAREKKTQRKHKMEETVVEKFKEVKEAKAMEKIEDELKKETHHVAHPHFRPAYSKEVHHRVQNRQENEVVREHSRMRPLPQVVENKKEELDEAEVMNEIKGVLKKYNEVHQKRKVGKAAHRADIAMLYQNKATPEGRRRNKEGHYDPRKPLFHQGM